MTYPTIKTQIKNYLTYLKNTKHSKHTIEAYNYALNKVFVEWYKQEGYNEINLLVLERYKTYLISTYKSNKNADVSIKTKNSYLNAVISFMRHIKEKEGLLDFDIPQKYLIKDKETQNKQPRYITKKQFDRIIESIGTTDKNKKESKKEKAIREARDRRDTAIFYLLFMTGLRAHELLNITTEQVLNARREMDAQQADSAKITITGKGNKTRPCWIHYTALNKIMDYEKRRTNKTNDPRLFPTTRQRLFEIVKKRSDTADIRDTEGNKIIISPHDLRHSFCIALLENSVQINKVQALAGHADLKTTAEYLKLIDSDVEKGYVSGITSMLRE